MLSLMLTSPGGLFFVFLLGLCWGSFVNCLAYRFHLRGVSPPEVGPLHLGGVLKRRSFCDHCGRQLQWWENIPIISWLILKARCRTCHFPIPYQYPVVEGLTGVLFWGALNHVGFRAQFGELVFWWLIVVAMMIIFTSDWLYGIIPDEVVFPAVLVTAIYRIVFSTFSTLLLYILSGLGAFLFFYLVVAVTRGKGMGMGDVKLAFLMGLLLGWPDIFIALWLAFVIGAMVASFLLVLHKKNFSDTMALGPFLVIGFWLAQFWGDILWKIFLPI